MKFENSRYYRVTCYEANGTIAETVKTGFECKILTRHCEYDEASDLYINHNIDRAYDIEEYHNHR